MGLLGAELRQSRLSQTLAGQEPTRWVLRCLAKVYSDAERSHLSELLSSLGSDLRMASLGADHAVMIYNPDLDGDWVGSDLDDRLRNLNWLAPRTQLHAEICNAVHMVSPSLPVGFGSVFSSEELMAETATRILTSMESSAPFILIGREWGLAVRLEEQGNVRLDSPETSSGTSYFQKLAAEKKQKMALRRDLSEMASLISQTLKDLGIQYRELPLRQDWGGEEKTTLARIAMLIHRDDSHSRERIAERLRQQRELSACRLSWSGPWAPFSFVNRVTQ